jgi:hypothetical protein
MAPRLRAVVNIQRIARGFLVRLRRDAAPFARLQARVKGMLARRWFRWETRRLRAAERLRWLREQADMALVAEDAVRLALESLGTKEGAAALAQHKKAIKVGGWMVEWGRSGEGVFWLCGCCRFLLAAAANDCGDDDAVVPALGQAEEKAAKAAAKAAPPSKEEKQLRSLRAAFELFDIDGSGAGKGRRASRTVGWAPFVPCVCVCRPIPFVGVQTVVHRVPCAVCCLR